MKPTISRSAILPGMGNNRMSSGVNIDTWQGAFRAEGLASLYRVVPNLMAANAQDVFVVNQQARDYALHEIPSVARLITHPGVAAMVVMRANGDVVVEHELVHLSDARCADGLTVGEQSAVGVDRQAAGDLGVAASDHLLLLAVLAEPVLGHVHDLRAHLGVLELGDVDVVGTDAGQLEAVTIATNMAGRGVDEAAANVHAQISV